MPARLDVAILKDGLLKKKKKKNEKKKTSKNMLWVLIRSATAMNHSLVFLVERRKVSKKYHLVLLSNKFSDFYSVQIEVNLNTVFIYKSIRTRNLYMFW